MTAPARVAEIPKDLDRILALPRRLPLDCERERGVRRWAPEAQAFIEVMTAKYRRKRLSCGCRDRHVVVTAGGGLTVFHQPPPGASPSPPFHTTVEAFLRDNAHDEQVRQTVSKLRAGESANLKGLGHPFCMTEFNPPQAWALRELPRTRGILGFLSVGSGKTALGILAPLAVPECKTVVILAKPNQRLHYRNHYLRLREHFRVPSIVFDKSGIKGSYIVPGMPVLHFIPYSMLSNTKSTLLLEQLDPDMVIGDEVHLLANPDAARTIRFLRLMNRRNGVIFCGWSGSLINKSLKDVSHLSAHALGLGSPYPIPSNVVNEWAAVMDPLHMPDYDSDTAKELMMAFGRSGNLERSFTFSNYISGGGVREGHRDWVIATPGVISTKSSSINCSITIRERNPGAIPKTIRDALSGVRNDELRPDGEPLVEAMHVVMTAREVGAGYYDYWAFPKHKCECDPALGNRCSECLLIDEWYDRRKAFYKRLRSKVRGGEPHLDSKSLCENAAERAWRIPRYEGDLPVWPEETWPPWAEIKDKVFYEPRTRWIDDYLAKDAAAWAQEHRGVVWCHSRAFGKKVAQLAGLYYHSGGLKGEELIQAEDGSRSIVASLSAYGESLDGLQHKFSEQLVAEPPASGKAWEQLLGRLAREGQRDDTVTTDLYLHTTEFRDAFKRAIMLAEFDEATTPNRQLLLAADLEFEI
jgi:hypothetical protein